jgi:hypothetical protein
MVEKVVWAIVHNMLRNYALVLNKKGSEKNYLQATLCDHFDRCFPHTKSKSKSKGKGKAHNFGFSV